METKKVLPLYEKGNGTVNFSVSIAIEAPLDEVWKNLVKASALKRYFIADATGDLDKTGEIIWSWEHESVLIKIVEVKEHQRVVCEWNANKEKYRLTCEFSLEKKGEKLVVRIKESGWEMNDDGVTSAFANCNGWTQFLDALKIYTEHGISIFD